MTNKYLIVFLLIISSCKVNQLNNNVRVGKWIEISCEDENKYKTTGSYDRNGVEKGKWKSYRNDTLISKERYIGDVSLIKNYHDNGKLLSKGKSKMDRSNPKKLHWFYFGKWHYYNDNGYLQYIRFFENGKEVNEIKINEN